MTVTPRNAVKFVDTTLNAHAEYEKLQSTIAELEGARRVHVQLTGTVRELRLQQKEYLASVEAKVRAEHDLPSQAAFDRKVKEVLADDATYAEFDRDIVQYSNDADIKEAEVRNLELHVKALHARVGQIGDILRFYAAHTEANTENSRRVFDPARG